MLPIGLIPLLSCLFRRPKAFSFADDQLSVQNNGVLEPSISYGKSYLLREKPIKEQGYRPIS